MIYEDWGLIPYQEALDQQLKYVQILQENPDHPGFLIFCTHPPVVTTGRQTLPEDIFSWKGEVIEISRGGRATYHGPSQLVVYPILNLKKTRPPHAENPRAAQEIRGYIRALEECIVLTLKEFEIKAIGRTPQKLPGEKSAQDETGVWVGQKKIASLGIAVKNWICFHGAAINLTYDPEAFIGLNPCGFKSDTMTSVESTLGKAVETEKFKNNLKLNCLSLL